MTDREMLEMAAKAAGYNFRWFKVKQWKNMKGIIGPYRYCTGTVDVYGSHHTKPWSPLTDDGDALRLAVKLRLMVNVCPYIIIATDGNTHAEEETCKQSDAKATRRAITRAAAQIGKEMK